VPLRADELIGDASKKKCQKKKKKKKSKKKKKKKKKKRQKHSKAQLQRMMRRSIGAVLRQQQQQQHRLMTTTSMSMLTRRTAMSSAPTSAATGLPTTPMAVTSMARSFSTKAQQADSVWARRFSSEFQQSLRKSIKLLSDRGQWWFAEAWVPKDDGLEKILLFYCLFLLTFFFFSVRSR
jgi:hypothetical protein